MPSSRNARQTHRAETDKVRGEQADLEREQAHLQPLSEARQKGSWWKPKYWQALFQTSAGPRLVEIQRRLGELEQMEQRLAGEEAALAEEGARLKQQHQADRQEIAQQEVSSRQANLGGRLQEVHKHQEQVQVRWEELCRLFRPGSVPEQPPGAADFQQTRERWRQQLADCEQELARAGQWLTGVEETARTFEQQLARRINLVAATLGALPVDPLFGGKTSPAVVFDLLVLDDAEQVTEADFLALSGRGRRWVLLGSPTPVEDPEPVEHKAASSRVVRSAALRTGFFAQLWERLHTDPRRLPYAWLVRQSRLCCRLHPIPPDQERWVQTEKVADRPDIELRIVSAPRTRPILAEVLFPQAIGIHEAKEYLYRELEELTVQAQSPSLRWLERPGQIVLRLAPDELTDARPVALEAGLRELVGCRPTNSEPSREGGTPWQTCCLEFDTASGWTRDEAERWVERRLNLRNLGRTVLLTSSQRMQPGLARWVSDVVLDGLLHSPVSCSVQQAVDFVMVPPASLSREGNEPAGRRFRDDPSGSAVRRQGGTATATPRRALTAGERVWKPIWPIRAVATSCRPSCAPCCLPRG